MLEPDGGVTTARPGGARRRASWRRALSTLPLVHQATALLERVRAAAGSEPPPADAGSLDRVRRACQDAGLLEAGPGAVGLSDHGAAWLGGSPAEQLELRQDLVVLHLVRALTEPQDGVDADLHAVETGGALASKLTAGPLDLQRRREDDPGEPPPEPA